MQEPPLLHFFIPILETLHDLGGSGRAAEVTDLVIERVSISEKELGEGARVNDQVATAKDHLAAAGYLRSSLRGTWTLTDKGSKTNPASIPLLATYKLAQQRIRDIRAARKKASPSLIEWAVVLVVIAFATGGIWCALMDELSYIYRAYKQAFGGTGSPNWSGLLSGASIILFSVAGGVLGSTSAVKKAREKALSPILTLAETIVNTVGTAIFGFFVGLFLPMIISEIGALF